MRESDLIIFRFKRFEFILAAILFAIFLFSSAVAVHNQSYRVNVSTTIGIDEFSQCRNCTNAGPRDLFVPTNTSTEWNKSYSFPPTGVSYACCSHYFLSCNGGDSWWYNGCGAAQELAQTCSGAFCGGSDVYSYTGCSGGSCTSSLTQTCSGNFCSGSDVYSYTACSGGACGSSLAQTCSGNFCQSNNVYSYTACSGGACGSSLAEDCQTGTNYCSGNDVRQHTACSGGSCGDSFVETCADHYDCNSNPIFEDGSSGFCGGGGCAGAGFCQPLNSYYYCHLFPGAFCDLGACQFWCGGDCTTESACF